MTTARTWSAWLCAAVPVALIYAAHLWFGANSSFAALALAAFEAAVLIGFLLLPNLRGSPVLSRPLLWIAAPFAFVLLVALASLSPAVPGGAHPIWGYVRGPGAATIDRSASLIEFAKLLGLACIFVVGGLLGASRDLSSRARKLVVGGGVVFALSALGFYLGRGPAADPRLTANLTSANCAATVLGVLAILSLPGLAGARSPQVRERGVERFLLAHAPAAGMLLLFLVGLALTASRAGMLSTGVAVVCFLAMQAQAGRMRVRTAIAAIAAFLLVGGVLLLTKGGLALERFGGLSLASNDRSPIFALHWAAFLQSPLFGYGLGAFASINRLLLDAQSYAGAWNVRDLHNLYLQWLEEGGLFAAVPMFGAVAVIIGLTVLGLRGRRRSTAWIRALIAADILVLCHATTDFALQVPSIAAMWSLLLGLQLGCAAQTAERRS